MKKTDLTCWLRGVQNALEAIDNDIENEAVQKILDDVGEQLNHVEPNTSFIDYLKTEHGDVDTISISMSNLTHYYNEWLQHD